jgi:hypothetical protein
MPKVDSVMILENEWVLGGMFCNVKGYCIMMELAIKYVKLTPFRIKQRKERVVIGVM